MAEWRDRGYVPDSDEEDDSQPSVRADLTISLKTFHTIRDNTGKVEDGFLEQPENRFDDEESTLRVAGSAEVQVSTIEESLSNKQDNAGLPGQERLRGNNGGDAQCAYAARSSDHLDIKSMFKDDGDIDELQDEYYKSGRMKAELRNGFAKADYQGQRAVSSTCPNKDLLSLQSSPLSEASKSQIELPVNTAEAQHSESQTTSSLPSSPTRHDTTEWLSRHQNEDHTESPLTTVQTEITNPRNLRHRNPIQLHPYAIEGEKYRQIFQARGVRPVRINQMEAEFRRAQEEDSQAREFNDEDNQSQEDVCDSNGLLSSSPPQPKDFLRDNSIQGSDVFDFEEEEFPDMAALLRQPSRQYSPHAFKRRKTDRPMFKMPTRLPTNSRIPPSEGRSNPVLEDDGILDVPPSPPSSGNQTPTRMNSSAMPKFRHPRRLASAALPTPVTSSEPRGRAAFELSEAETSDTHSRRDSPAIDASQSSDAAADDLRSNQLERAQRRIRGVLPASWLKLDLKKQTKKLADDRKIHRSISPEGNPMQRGVARLVSPEGIKSPVLQGRPQSATKPSEDEETDSDDGWISRRLQRKSRYSTVDENKGGFLNSRQGEALEDDRINAMLQPIARSRGPLKVRKKRQMKMVDFDVYPKSAAVEPSRERRIEHSYKPRTYGLFEKGPKKKPKFRLPKLSILDAPSPAQPEQDGVPYFFRIASRTARQRNDKGRHSPSRKFVQLATREDTYDACETLSRWRKGTIAPKVATNASATYGRQPLYPRSANAVLSPQRPDLPSVTKRTSHAPLITRISKLKPRSSKAQRTQSSLDALLECQPYRRSRESSKDTRPYAEPKLQTVRFKKQGQLVSTLRSISDSRPAMLETLQEDEDRSFPRAAFQRGLSNVNLFSNDQRTPGALWNRFFAGETPFAGSSSQIRESDPASKASSKHQNPVTDHRPRASRKRRPRQMDVSIPRSRQSSEPVIVDDLPDDHPAPLACETPGTRRLLGLSPFGTQYSTTLDITPLPSGTCFHERTFLGSGELKNSLKLKDRHDLATPRGISLLAHEERHFRWGPWNETVSSEIVDSFGSISDMVPRLSPGNRQSFVSPDGRNLCSLLRGIIRYFSDHLSFLDLVDRISCLQRCKDMLSSLSFEVDNCNIFEGKENAPSYCGVTDITTQLNMLCLVFANQLRQIAEHEIVPQALKDEIRSMVSGWGRKTFVVLTNNSEEFTRCLSRYKQFDSVHSSIIQDHDSVEALVVTHHVFCQHPNLSLDFRELMQSLIPNVETVDNLDARTLERSWQRLYRILPFLEFDSQGILETGRRFKYLLESWRTVKRLISPVFDIYIANPRGQAPSFNAYCRALFGRCLHLINGWGWRLCDSIIGTLFDFFARNSLNHLRNEESRGSPLFLRHLDEKVSLNPEPEDRCFHVLLKIIASGLKHMRQLYPEKKIRDIVWRLMPNHGRFLPKEEAIRQGDLDALQNHHDLLCTLYWAAPSNYRPRLNVIRNLVHLETSHREACHINIRAWLNLIKFQLSTNEPTSSLESFMEWHDDLLQVILRQHSLARTEAEEQVRSVQHPGGLAISKEALESIIAKNQRQMEAILSDALVSLKMAIDLARTKAAAAALLTSSALTAVFNLFDARRPQANIAIIQALDVLSAYVNRFLAIDGQSGSRSDIDDSQDYGDWSAFNDEVLGTPPGQETTQPLRFIQEPLRHLLSNCFGADVLPNEALLLRLVEVWVAVGHLLVKDGFKTWNDYIGRFGNDSWSSLRDTEQTRKFTAHYLAVLIEKDIAIYRTNKLFFQTSWIGSLVERESLLKYQHKYTSTLLNAECEDPLFINLPFWKNAKSASFEITSADFSQRRLSLISSVLSNMRVSMEGAVSDQLVDAGRLKQEFKELLKHLMATMKQNYQELGQGSNVRGAYVDFVHQIVEFLQQHTSNICSIDRFFTDSGAFPLPATDPTYVVGQLKNYALRLEDPRTPKQLAVFLQSVSERAAIDGQQACLVGQLYTAMSNTFESGAGRPILRTFLIRSIIPAYIEVAFDEPSGWILAVPFLQTLQKVFEELLMDVDGTDLDSVASVASVITAFLDSVSKGVASLLLNPSSLRKPSVLKVMTACYSAVTTLLPTQDYVTRLDAATKSAEQTIDFLRSFANSYSVIEDRPDTVSFDISEQDPNLEEASYTVIRRFASQELRATLKKNWICNGEEYFVLKGASRREVVVDIGLIEEEKEHLAKTLKAFFACLGAMPALRNDDDEDEVFRRRRIRAGGERDEMFF